MIKAILLDIDGTLTNKDKVITPRTKEALLKAQNAGITLALASGRADQGLMKWAKELEMDKNNGIFVCFNGAKVMNCQTGEIYFHQCMDVKDAQDVLEHLKKFDARPIVAAGEYMYLNDVYDNMITLNGKPFNVVQYESRSNGYILCEKKDMAAFFDFPVEKILTYGEPEYLQAHNQEMEAPFKNRLSCMFTGPFYFEYTAKGVDKAKAIDSAFSKLGISADEMIAYGDAQNDNSMLKYCGIGVAMANAVEETKAIADEITLDNNSDGIAVSLYRHLPAIFSEE